MRVPGHERKSYAWRWTAALAGLAVLVFALVMALVVTPSTHVQAGPMTWTVDRADDPNTGADADGDGMFDPTAAVSACTTSNTSDCSLRGAIMRANLNVGHSATGTQSDTINFASGLAGSTITLLGDGMVLNDATLAGTTINGPGGGGIVVTGAGAAPCFTLVTPSNTIQGLVISGCAGAGISVSGTSTGNLIRNNRIGTNAAGTAASANAVGIDILVGANGNTIGGTSAADANLISGNTGIPGIGVEVLSNNNVIRGNIIGMDVNGTSPIPNGVGVDLAGAASGNTVGGTAAGSRNLISGNTTSGVSIAGSGNVVEGNCIGTQWTCTIAAPNGVDGVTITGSNNTVGGTAAGAGNTIAFNALGVDIAGGTNNVVVRNVMFLNGTGIASGALVGPAITGCSDAGGGNVSCTGTSPAPGYSVDVYRANTDIAGNPQGDLWLCNTTSGGGSAWGCTFPNPGGGSATATQRLAPGNTSAFTVAIAGIPAGPAITATPTTIPATATAAAAATATATVATSTPVKTSTPTSTAIPGATATPTTGPMESVTLVGGTCNPVASSYADATPIATIAGAVSPSGILISIWKFDPGTGMWLGYSPQFPQANDLSQVDRLDAIFICVSSAGTWSRPLIA